MLGVSLFAKIWLSSLWITIIVTALVVPLAIALWHVVSPKTYLLKISDSEITLSISGKAIKRFGMDEVGAIAYDFKASPPTLVFRTADRSILKTPDLLLSDLKTLQDWLVAQKRSGRVVIIDLSDGPSARAQWSERHTI